MNLTAKAVHWGHFTEAIANGQLSDILFEEIEYKKELLYRPTPWPSDSSHEYMEVAAQLAICVVGNKNLEVIATELINEDIVLPNEAGGTVDPELVSGALAPKSVNRFCEIFDQLELTELDASIVEYLNQWKAMLNFAKSKDAGVYFHLG